MSSRIALMAVVLTASLPLPLQAHDIYSHLKDQGGESCCHDRDCRPAFYRFNLSQLQMFVDGQWIDVPGSTIQYRALPSDTGETGGGHWCGLVYIPNIGAIHLTRCAILPPQFASVQVDPP
jgi:hypothetical protein